MPLSVFLGRLGLETIGKHSGVMIPGLFLYLFFSIFINFITVTASPVASGQEDPSSDLTTALNFDDSALVESDFALADTQRNTSPENVATDLSGSTWTAANDLTSAQPDSTSLMAQKNSDENCNKRQNDGKNPSCVSPSPDEPHYIDCIYKSQV